MNGLGKAGLSTILLVEDDKMTRMLLRDTLDAEDFLILEAANGSRSMEIIGAHDISLIVLDLNLPDISGIDLISQIRTKTAVPLVIVSGDGDEQKKVRSFESGADDFVSKPFHPAVLAARIRAHIRRYSEIEETILENDRHHRLGEIYFHGWRVDPLKFQLFHESGRSAELSCAEFKILHYLIAHCERVIRRDELAEIVKEGEGAPISDRAIDVKITRIRKKIGDHAGQPEIIKTVYGAGYLFNQDYLQKNFGNTLT